MPSNLLSIGLSGTRAARLALDVAAQNIANASSDGYVRRSVRLAEVSSSGGIGTIGDVSLSGVRLDRVVRNADMFRQAEVRRTGADAARANAELAGLENVESALEQANLYPAIVQFEAALQHLAGDPVDPALRAAVIEDTRTLTRAFDVASSSLDAAGEGLRFEAAAGVDQVNLLAGELGRVNLRLTRAADATSDQSTLLDQRDNLLRQLSELTDITTSFSSDNTVNVRLGGAGGPALVAGGATQTLAMQTGADGTIGFTLNGTGVALAAGSLAGRAQALEQVAESHAALDDLAAGMIATVNASQAQGTALDGSAGQPLLAGTDAASITLATSDGALIATAPAGADANSRDPANLDGLRAALAAADPAGAMDSLLFTVSGAVAGRNVTRDALESIAGSARMALEAQSGVDLDQEAMNLVRFQQAFQASGKAMQVATEIFDSLLGIG